MHRCLVSHPSVVRISKVVMSVRNGCGASRGLKI